jgi:pantoate--beta-alanine ligase
MIQDGATVEAAHDIIAATIATEPLATLGAIDIVDPATFAPATGTPSGPVGIMISAEFGEVMLIDQKEVTP